MKSLLNLFENHNYSFFKLGCVFTAILKDLCCFPVELLGYAQLSFMKRSEN